MKRKRTEPERGGRRAARRQRMLRAIGRVLFMGVLLTAAILAMTVFFQVDTITVEGATHYTAEEIIASLDVKQGDNLYLWNKVKTSEALLAEFPYLETVQMRRRLPDGIVVSVTECVEALAVPSDAGYYRVSTHGKVLAQTPDDGGLPLAVGVTLMGMAPGEQIDRSQDAYADALMTALEALDKEAMLADTDFVNLQSLTDVRIGYLGRFDIRVGTVDELSYRLQFARTVIHDRLSPSDVGRLNWDSRRRLHFVPDTAENVAKSAGLQSGTDDAAAPPASGDDAANPVGAEPDGEDSEDGEDGVGDGGTGGEPPSPEVGTE